MCKKKRTTKYFVKKATAIIIMNGKKKFGSLI